MNKRILVVEDDPNLGFVIQDNLKQKGYDVTLCKDGVEGEEAFQSSSFNLCIFDIMLPKMDGISLAQRVRKQDKNIPILFLTAKSMVEDRLDGFRAGADDYITKPFSMEELLYRIDVFLRRSNEPNTLFEGIIQLGRYHFNCDNFTIKIDSTEKTLTQKEAEVLKILYQNRERVLKREEILGKIWGDDDYFMGRSMDVFISRLRKYLKEDPRVQIVNYHGVGFRLEIR